MIDLYVAEDHAGMRAIVKSMLKGSQDFRLVAESINGLDVADKVQELKPHVVLMDVMMPAIDGISATRQVMEQVPEARILIFSSAEGDDHILSAVEAGASGYLLKKHAADLLKAIREVASGFNEFWMDSAISERWCPKALAVIAGRSS
jgi:DNA-binding NarL/FixJ family response regulator